MNLCESSYDPHLWWAENGALLYTPERVNIQRETPVSETQMPSDGTHIQLAHWINIGPYFSSNIQQHDR